MRTVAEHLNTCLSLGAPLDPLDVLLPDAVGCVLAEDVSAPFDLPVTDQATLDGYAVRSQDVGGAGKGAPEAIRTALFSTKVHGSASPAFTSAITSRKTWRILPAPPTSWERTA